MSNGSQRWEYKHEYWKNRAGSDLEKLLNKFGEDGWELIALSWDNDETGCGLTFKRPKS